MEFKKSHPVSIVSGRLQFLVKCSKNMDKFIITEISSLFLKAIWQERLKLVWTHPPIVYIHVC